MAFWDVKINGRFYDTVYFEGSRQKLLDELQKTHPNKTIKVIKVKA